VHEALRYCARDTSHILHELIVHILHELIVSVLPNDRKWPDEQVLEKHVDRHTEVPAYVSIRQHTSAYVSIRQHTSAYVSIRQHTSAHVSIRRHTSAYVSIQHTTQKYQNPPIVPKTSRNICEWPAHVSIRQHTSAYVSIRQHTSAYVSTCERPKRLTTCACASIFGPSLSFGSEGPACTLRPITSVFVLLY
jgi:hypothetical protein